MGMALGLAWAIPEDMVPEKLRGKHQEFLRSTFGPRAQKLGLEVGAKDDEDTRLWSGFALGCRCHLITSVPCLNVAFTILV